MADFKRQPKAEPEYGLGAIISLAATLVCLGPQACRFMGQDNGRFDLVAVLSTWSTPSRKLGGALFE